MTDPEILISRYFEDPESMTQHDMDQLSEWIKQGPSHAKQFAQAAFVHRGVYDSLTSEQTQEALTGPLSSPSADDSGFRWDDHFWHRIAKYENTAPAVNIEKPDSTEEQLQKPEPAKDIVKTNRALLLVSAFCVAAVLFLCVVRQIQEFWFPPEVATLGSSMQAEWADSAAPKPGGRLTRREGPLRLMRGIVDIVFDSGAEAVIEGPAQFRLKSANRIEFLSGRLFAEVPPSAKGFTVETRYAKIVDLGTEFGIVADTGRATDVHMFKGKASLVQGTGARAGKGQTLIGGQARSVDNTAAVKDIHIQEDGFVRRFSARTGFVWKGQAIDLADVVGGGNGSGTGQLCRWLEISTGLDGTRYIVNGQATKPYQTTDNRYHRVSHLPYVNGVFSPDGSAGSVQVSSRGDNWQDCPHTSGRFFEDIFNGNYISVSDDSHGFVLGGQAFGTREHPAIAVHSNAGITFDLDALRRDMPGLEITGFKATCGVSEDVKKHPEDAQQGKSDFWVLVDGQKRFEAIGMDANAKPQEISVSLGGQERFLTLVSTDGDGRPNYDWCFFAEPRLEVRVVQKE
jgi:hypothetical protein